MRISEIDPNNLSTEQQVIYDRITAGPRGQVRGPYHAWLRNPGYCDQVEKMGHYLRFAAILPGNLRELAIITVARHWKAEFEWFAHAPVALREGVSEEIVATIERGDTPSFTDTNEAAIHAFVHELLRSGHVSDAAYQGMVGMVGEDGVVELIGLVGHYTGVAMTLNSFAIVPPEGERPNFGTG
jgi:4-carboxymuconolactone decarboxylase